MENNVSICPSRTYRDLSSKTRTEELQNLQTLIRTADPVTVPLLSDWVSGSDDRRALLSGTVWSGIRWPKGMGRPKSPSITAGFSIDHIFMKSDMVAVGNGKYEERGKFVPVPPPSMWDASTASHHRVAFFAYALGGLLDQNILSITFAQVAWQFGLLFSPGYLRLDPYGVIYFKNRGERTVYPDFEVNVQPYRRDRSVQPLGPLRTLATPSQSDSHREAAESGAD